MSIIFTSQKIKFWNYPCSLNSPHTHHLGSSYIVFVFMEKKCTTWISRLIIMDINVLVMVLHHKVKCIINYIPPLLDFCYTFTRPQKFRIYVRCVYIFIFYILTITLTIVISGSTMSVN